MARVTRPPPNRGFHLSCDPVQDTWGVACGAIRAVGDLAVDHNEVVSSRVRLSPPIAIGHIVHDLILAHVEVQFLKLINQNIRLKTRKQSAAPEQGPRGPGIAVG